MLVLGLVLLLLLLLLGPSGASKRLSNTWHFVGDLNHRMHVYLQVDTPLPAYVTFSFLDYEQHVCKQMTLLHMQLWDDGRIMESLLGAPDSGVRQLLGLMVLMVFHHLPNEAMVRYHRSRVREASF